VERQVIGQLLRFTNQPISSTQRCTQPTVYIMSVSPPKEGADAGDAATDNSDQMDRGEETQAREAYDFEVKEQDRWLPIANGWSPKLLMQSHPIECAGLPLRRCMMMAVPECIVACEGQHAQPPTGFLTHSLLLRSLKICASIFSTFPMVKQRFPSGHSQCLGIPRLPSYHRNAVVDSTPTYLILTYVTSLQWPEL